MLQKEYEGGLIHMMVFAFFIGIPQDRGTSISVFSLFENWSRAFYCKTPHFHFARNISNAPFSQFWNFYILSMKMRYFE